MHHISDNGGSATYGGSNFPLRGAKWGLWEGGIRSHGFVHGQRLDERGETRRGLMHITDWFPTLLHLAASDDMDDADEEEDDSLAGLDGYNMWNMIR